MGRVVGPGDPQWTRVDRLVALAWQQEQDEMCPGCSRLWSETADPDAFEDYDAKPVVCHACAERQRAGEKYQKADGGVPHGLYIAVTRRQDEWMR